MSYILLIEDNQANADMIIRILESAKHRVRHTLHGLEGAQIARREHPDMILMDFDLPDVDGRTMAIVLKKQLGGISAPPIVAVTARGGETEKRIAQHLGFAAFVSKPFSPEELLNTVERLLTKAVPPRPAESAVRKTDTNPNIPRPAESAIRKTDTNPNIARPAEPAVRKTDTNPNIPRPTDSSIRKTDTNPNIPRPAETPVWSTETKPNPPKPADSTTLSPERKS